AGRRRAASRTSGTPARPAPCPGAPGRPAPRGRDLSCRERYVQWMFSSPLAEQLAPDLLDRFLRYVRVATQSARGPRAQSPSTPGQLALARMLAAELRLAGLEDAFLDENGYVVATLPATVEDAPVIGLIAHVDTAPDAPGDGVEPIVHRNYDGG